MPSLSDATLLAHVDRLLIEAFVACGFDAQGVRAVPAQRPDLADLQCNAIMALAGRMKRPPRELAEAVVAQLDRPDDFAAVSVAGPGFINLTLSDTLLSTYAMTQAASPHGGIVAQPAQTIVIDFGGPNVAKPLHVGHLRSLVIGESLRRILGAQGHRVITDVHLGDWGLQMGMLISEALLLWPELAEDGPWRATPPFDMQTLQVLYPRVAASCKSDPARMAIARAATAELQAGSERHVRIWEVIRAVSLDAQTRDFVTLDAHFDELLGESHVQPLIPAMVADLVDRGVAIRSDGALVIDIAQEGDESPMPPLLLEKSDGASLYATTDLATILDRQQRHHPDRIVYVVDQRQSLHFAQVFRASEKAGFSGNTQLVHVGFGTVNGADGKPYKTRDGGVAQLRDLLADALEKAQARQTEGGSPRAGSAPDTMLAAAIGMAAVKFADLSTYRTSGYSFDADRMVSFEGRTGPYVQYACVRIASLLERAAQAGTTPGAIQVHEPTERQLVLLCARFPEVVASAAARYAPNEIADFAFDLAQSFSRFYAECPVLNAANAGHRSSRLALAALTRDVLSTALDLLGIRVPARM